MATVNQHRDRRGRDPRSRPAADRHRGQDTLAEVIMIRPARSYPTGLVGLLVTMARAFASPRAQATSVRSTPRPPSSPAPLSYPPPWVPHDAA
jgi:hypothetical protein